MLSIVIPSKNEEKYIKNLLNSLKHQTFKDFEIIVSDNSDDSTRKISKKYGAKIVYGGKHPGPGRNNGAKIAKGSDILFLDADVILPHNFLERNYSEFKKNGFSVASVLSKPIEDDFFLKLIYQQSRLYMVLFEKIIPTAAGWVIFVKKDWFDRVKGFDEKIALGEDHDFIRRICKNGGTFEILNGPWVSVSSRRIKKEGNIGYIRKHISSFIYQVFMGHVHHGLIKYEFGKF